MPAVPQSVSDHAWFKSSYSGGNETECVEAAPVAAGVLIRDSKRPDGPCLSVPAEAWTSFIANALD
ncbi:DUF397 domain-containing protein [Streptomyces ruber]|uniref:DUF397 domain-containing protein n=2 Tax=Streptomyces TaxID=1883 RepID=A0A918BAP3_9ACTN|nr:DUF397 domain-containing protein [Streptomyces ruber]GGQ54286.1 DUF397 domain-containing protein [Streptomyces ruber]